METDRGRVGGDPCFDVEGRRSHGQVEERALAVAEIVETALAARLIGMEAFAAPLASFGAIAVGECRPSLGSAGKIRGAWSCRRRTGARSLGRRRPRRSARTVVIAEALSEGRIREWFFADGVTRRILQALPVQIDDIALEPSVVGQDLPRQRMVAFAKP